MAIFLNKDNSEKVKNHFLRMEQVGSTVTCNPPVTDTDTDFLILIKDSSIVVSKVHGKLINSGWTHSGVGYGIAGEEPGEVAKPIQTYRKGRINYIITWDVNYFDKFMDATHLAKQFNLLQKRDRVALFEYITWNKKVWA